jgi:hypothetical protein
MAEVHGCGADAKRAARAQHKAAAAPPVATLSSTQRVHVARKLDKKMEEMQASRSKKKDDKKDGKK